MQTPWLTDMEVTTPALVSYKGISCRGLSKIHPKKEVVQVICFSWVGLDPQRIGSTLRHLDPTVSPKASLRGPLGPPDMDSTLELRTLRGGHRGVRAGRAQRSDRGGVSWFGSRVKDRVRDLNTT